jgi:hypothetical protein
VIHVGNDSDVANIRIQIENSSGLQIGAYYYFTMARSFAAVDRGLLRPRPEIDTLLIQRSQEHHAVFDHYAA